MYVCISWSGKGHGKTEEADVRVTLQVKTSVPAVMDGKDPAADVNVNVIGRSTVFGPITHTCPSSGVQNLITMIG